MSFRSGHDTKGASRESTAKGRFPAETVKFLWTVTGTHIEDSRRLWYDIGKSISIAFVEVFCAGSAQSPLLLTEGGTAQAVTGVEGTRYEFPDCPERGAAPHPSRQKA